MRVKREGADVGPYIEDTGAVTEVDPMAAVDLLLENVLVEVIRLGPALIHNPHAVGPDVDPPGIDPWIGHRRLGPDLHLGLEPVPLALERIGWERDPPTSAHVGRLP